MMNDVDVLLPVRFPAHWLGETLAGLADQVGGWRNVIIVIHGNRANLDDIILASGIMATVVTAKDELNLSEVLNLGLAHCHSEFTARIDQDDIPLPQRFQTQASYLRDNPDVIVVGSNAILIDEGGSEIGVRRIGSGRSKIGRRLRWKSPLIHPSVMYRTDQIKDIGGYHPIALHVEDFDLWLRCRTVGALDNLTSPLICYRIHSGQTSQSRSSSFAGLRRIGKSRRALAQMQGESIFLARLRQAIWVMRQLPRMLRRSM